MISNIKISDEQQIIVDNLLLGYNIIVDAVAGSGKTTTILWYSLKSSTKILVLTYNKRLKLETRSKVSELKLQNRVEVHSYHSMGVKYYDDQCFTDSGIIDIINKNYNRRKNYQYDVIIIDEAQDMTTTYFAFINKIIIDNGKIPQLFIIGDKYQSIFTFNNADSRFITYAKQIFPSNTDTKWVNNDLKTSFRVTIPMANFYNNCIFGYEKIISIKESSVKPTYFICNTFGKFNLIIKEIMDLLKIYSPSDIFVLAPTIRSVKTPVRRLANELSTKGYEIYVSNGDEDRLDSDVIAHKLVFTTFHSVKGLERKVVFVYGMDNSYFTYFAKTLDVKICPNTIYVAITRATERLYMIHHFTKDYLPFINVEKLSTYCNIIGPQQQIVKTIYDKIAEILCLIKHMDTILDKIVRVLDLIKHMGAGSCETLRVLNPTNIIRVLDIIEHMNRNSNHIVIVLNLIEHMNMSSDKIFRVLKLIKRIKRIDMKSSDRVTVLHILKYMYSNSDPIVRVLDLIKHMNANSNYIFIVLYIIEYMNMNPDDIVIVLDLIKHINTISTEKIGVVELIKHLDSNILKTAISGTKYIKHPKYKYNSMINLTHKITAYKNNNVMTESVADLNGIALPMYLEQRIKSSVTICELLFLHEKFKKYLIKYEIYPTGTYDSCKFLRLANSYNYHKTGYNYKMNQIKKYNWLTTNTFDEVINKSEKILWNEDRPLNKESIFFEKGVSGEIENRRINGSIDLIDEHNKIVWELKCVSELTEDHLLQLLIYAYLLNKDGYKYYLFNMISGEVIELIFDRHNAGKSISYLIREKYSTTKITDEIFISNILHIRNTKNITNSKKDIREDDMENPFDINKIIG